MKKSLGILQIVAILFIGIVIGAFSERSHVFGYSDNTTIIPNGTYQTTGVGSWSQLTITKTRFLTKTASAVIVDNRFTSRKSGLLVLALKTSGNTSRSYEVHKISEGWRVTPFVKGVKDPASSFIIYLNK